MSDFRIKVNVDLDTAQAEAKMKALADSGKDIKLKVDLGNLESQIKSIGNLLKKAFELDGSVSDINKVSKALKEVSQAQDKVVKGVSGDKSLISQYKDLSNTVEKLQKQMNKGGMGEDSIKRTLMQVSELKGKMNELYSKMSDNAKQNIDLFNTKQTTKGIADMNQAMTKIETTANSLRTKIEGIDFSHVDTSNLERIKTELEQIKSVAKEDINLDLNVGDILSELDRISSEIKNLEKVENLASSFDEIKGSISSASGEVEQFGNTIKELEGQAKNLDGSFDKAFKSANTQMKEMKNTAKSMSSGKGGLLGNIFGTKDDFFSNFAQFKVAEVLAEGVITGLRKAGEVIVETDKAMTDLGKVAPDSFNNSSKAMKSYLKDVTQVAKDTGKTSVDVINGTAKALQSGIKNMDDALKYSKGSAVFANVGDIEQEQADRYLAGIMSAYGGVDKALQPVRKTVQGMGKDYDNLTNFIDQANWAGNNYAVSTADVGEILMQSSSALSTMGVSMQENIAKPMAR